MSKQHIIAVPWITQEMPSRCNDRITADDGEGTTICEFPYGLDANAAFIVKAANAHDDLVEALRAIASGTSETDMRRCAKEAIAKVSV